MIRVIVDGNAKKISLGIERDLRARKNEYTYIIQDYTYFS